MTRTEQWAALAELSKQARRTARPCPICGEPARNLGGQLWQCVNHECPVRGSFSTEEEPS